MSKLILTVAVMVSFAFIFYFIAFVISLIVSGVSYTELTQILTDQTQYGSVYMMKFFQIMLSVGMFVVPGFVLNYFFSKSGSEFIPFRRNIDMRSIIITIVVMVIALPLINFIVELNINMRLPEVFSGVEQKIKEMEQNAENLMERLLKADTLSQFSMNLLMIAIIPAIGEELIFRGILQRILTDWFKREHLAIAISAIAFSAFHMQFYGFLPRFLLGLFFGYLLIWSGSVWLPILGHFMNNALAVTFYFLYQNNYIKINADKIGTEEIYSVIISFTMVSILVFLLYRMEKERREELAF